MQAAAGGRPTPPRQGCLRCGEGARLRGRVARKREDGRKGGLPRAVVRRRPGLLPAARAGPAAVVLVAQRAFLDAGHRQRHASLRVCVCASSRRSLDRGSAPCESVSVCVPRTQRNPVRARWPCVRARVVPALGAADAGRRCVSLQQQLRRLRCAPRRPAGSPQCMRAG